MTAVDPEARAVPPPRVADRATVRPPTRICPYLAAADGAWRSATVEREHRCGAVAPPAPLAAEKQRRLCLTADYGTCSTFEAARAARPVAHLRPPTLPRPLARTTPLVLDHGRMFITVPALRTERSNGQALLVILMALAFAAIVVAKLTGGSAPAAVGNSSSPSATASAAGSSPAATVRRTAAPTAKPGGSAAPTTGSGSAAPPTAGQSAAPAGRTYKVKAGDTIIGIAAKFGTTPQAITKLNGITDPSSLKVGQVLKIP
jgi:LysM repeat protein